MDYVYIENYKGFSQAYFPLMSTTFLVGENSTGKSTVLALIKFLKEIESPMRWSRGSFKFLGEFSEAVSQGSSDRSYFRLGLFSTLKKNERWITSCTCYQFRNSGGQSFLEGYFRKIDNQAITFLLKGKVRFRIDTADDDFNSEKQAIDDCVVNMSTCGRVREGKGFTFLKRYPPQNAHVPFGFQIVDSFYQMNNQHLDDSVGEFLSKVLFEESVDAGSVCSLAPVRTAPRKVYDFQDSGRTGEDISAFLTLNELVGSKSRKAKKEKEELEKFGKKSGLFDALSTQTFGRRTPTTPFKVLVTYGNVSSNIKNVGYGVSQILPIMMSFYEKGSATWRLLQQPEVHLHPRAQAQFGEFLFEQSLEDESVTLVETHSDFIIDRYRLCQHRADIPSSAQVLFFEKKGDENFVTPVIIEDDGNYQENQPAAFRDFFLRESLDLLEI